MLSSRSISTSLLLAFIAGCSVSQFDGGVPFTPKKLANAEPKTKTSDSPPHKKSSESTALQTTADSNATSTKDIAPDEPPADAAPDTPDATIPVVTPDMPDVLPPVVTPDMPDVLPPVVTPDMPSTTTCGAACVEVCGRKIQFTNYMGNPTGGSVSTSGSTANVDLLSPASRRAFVSVSADSSCNISVTLRSGAPFMCHMPGGNRCSVVASPAEGGFGYNCFSPIYYSINGGERSKHPHPGFMVYPYPDGESRPCPPTNICQVKGREGAIHFSGYLDLGGCVSKCSEFSDKAFRSCTYAGFNVRN